MKVKELFNKLEGYNTIASITGERTRYIVFEFEGSKIAYTKDYKDFKNRIMHELTPMSVKAILDFDGFVFEDDRIVEFIDSFGYVHQCPCSIYLSI